MKVGHVEGVSGIILLLQEKTCCDCLQPKDTIEALSSCCETRERERERKGYSAYHFLHLINSRHSCDVCGSRTGKKEQENSWRLLRDCYSVDFGIPFKNKKHETTCGIGFEGKLWMGWQQDCWRGWKNWCERTSQGMTWESLSMSMTTINNIQERDDKTGRRKFCHIFFS